MCMYIYIESCPTMETYPIISRNPNIYSGKHLSFSLIRR